MGANHESFVGILNKEIDMTGEKIFVSTSSFAEFSQEPLMLLEQAGYRCVLNPHGRTLKSDEIVALLQNCVGLVAGTEKLSADILSQLNQLRVISRCGAGVDNIDLAKAKEMKIKIFNTPDAPTLAVAELTLGLMLDLLRKISFMNQETHGLKWKKHMGSLLHGKRVGIIGLGRIGKKVAEMLKNFGCEVAYYDPHVEPDSLGVARKSLSDLLQWAEIVTIHVSQANSIIGRAELELLSKESLVINTSRGGVIDEEALFTFLRDKRIAGAALDVFNKEPYQGPLCELDNIILTPHIGSYAKEARINMEREAVNNLLKGLKG